ncbi:ECF transporter S component [Lachnospiraceae bacterium oral taxon 500]|nr:ECF transporter S component [Lachnospiraceae bacterium oral taxon 500]
MKPTFKPAELTKAAFFIAMGIVLPMGFHFFQMGGPVFLPMHIPVLLAGFFLSPLPAVMVGLLTPLLSSILTSMPPLFPMAVIMMVELAAYAGLVSFSRQRRLVENRSLAQILCLLIAMLGGRIAAGLVVFVLSLTVAGIQLSPLPYLIGAVTKGLPGIILQLIFIPSLLLLLNKARVYDN